MDLKDAAAVRAHYGEPSHIVKAKQLARLDRHSRAFIALSPMVIVATVGADGRADASPRGGAPGFVVAPDDSTLLIPDRAGNRRADTILNIAAHPQAGLLFLVPGIDETLRVNGPARVTIDPEVLAPLAFEGKLPVSAIAVSVEEVFFHCGKPLMRSEFWNPERHVPRGSFPSLGRILADQIEGGDADAYESGIAESYRTRLY